MMTTKTKLGIWMDHANAYLIEYMSEDNETRKVDAHHPLQSYEHEPSEHDSVVHSNPDQLAAYYKTLSSIISNYDYVVLFGPTDAKVELHNILKDNQRFDDMTVEVRQTDKMTENQKSAFVKEYFSNHHVVNN
jgi:hypothetical protein